MMTATHNALIRSALSVATLSVLALTACGGDDSAEAEFEQSGSGEETARADDATVPADEERVPEDDADQDAEQPRTDPGFTFEGLSREVTVTDSQQPDEGQVITPTGTLTVTEVETIEAVAAEEIGLEPEYAEGGDVDGDADPLDYAPAEGEEFRVLNLSFSQDEGAEHGETTSVALASDGSQEHLVDLGGEQELRILISVPREAQLVVSCDGHDQYMDALSGEREDDEVAAGYYRDVTGQDVNHTFPTETVDLAITSERGSQEGVVNFDAHVSSANLAGWAEGEGWASEGEAWLVVEWNYEAGLEDYPMGVDIEEAWFTLSAAAKGETYSQEEHAESVVPRGEVTTAFSVPVDVVDVDISLEGSAAVDAPGGRLDIGTPNPTFETEELPVAFPSEGGANDESPADEGGSD